VPPLALYDVDDTQRFVAGIVNRSGLSLNWSDRQDLEQSLLIVAWELSLKFEPGQSSVGFSTYCGTILRRRTNDWVRKRSGRTVWKFKDRVHERQLPSFVSIDDQFTPDSLGNALATRGGNASADRLENDGGLFGDRDRRRARDLETLGDGSAR
jgi:DNA-directed RNA polymerase specialized sigma24 family protein